MVTFYSAAVRCSFVIPIVILVFGLLLVGLVTSPVFFVRHFHVKPTQIEVFFFFFLVFHFFMLMYHNFELSCAAHSIAKFHLQFAQLRVLQRAFG